MLRVTRVVESSGCCCCLDLAMDPLCLMLVRSVCYAAHQTALHPLHSRFLLSRCVCARAMSLSPLMGEDGLPQPTADVAAMAAETEQHLLRDVATGVLAEEALLHAAAAQLEHRNKDEIKAAQAQKREIELQVKRTHTGAARRHLAGRSRSCTDCALASTFFPCVHRIACR